MTTDPWGALVRVTTHLLAEGCPHALVGGIAVSIRSEPRFTRDIDMAVDVADDAAFGALSLALSSRGYRIATVLVHEPSDRLATVRLLDRQGVLVDLIGGSTGLEPEIVRRATDLELEGIGRVRVARAEELLAMKVLAFRPGREKDLMDACSLLRLNRRLDLSAVRACLATIAHRGYDRGQDLEAKLAEVLERASIDPDL